MGSYLKKLGLHLIINIDNILIRNSLKKGVITEVGKAIILLQHIGFKNYFWKVDRGTRQNDGVFGPSDELRKFILCAAGQKTVGS